MVIYFLIGLIVLLVLVCLGQLVSHRRWEKRIDAQLQDAATREAWWRKKALQPKTIAPPPVPMTAEEWRSRARTRCARPSSIRHGAKTRLSSEYDLYCRRARLDGR